MKKQYIQTGKITGTHGIRGEMRVDPWCDSPEFLTRFSVLYLDGQGKNRLDIKSARAHKNIVLLKAEGIDTIEQAETLRNKIIYINREDARLEEGSHFIEDLIGCRVLDLESGREYGSLCDISKTGANDVWHILSEDKKEYLLPAIPDVVKSVDVDGGIIKITPLKGIFDDEN